jgi:hypothetical protein
MTRPAVAVHSREAQLLAGDADAQAGDGQPRPEPERFLGCRSGRGTALGALSSRAAGLAVVAAMGFLVGLAVGAPLWLTVPAPRDLIQHCAREVSTLSLGGASLPLDCPAAYALSRPTVVPPLLLAGGLFGALAQRRARRGSPGAVTLVGVVGLFLVTFGGAQLVNWLDGPVQELYASWPGVGDALLAPGVFMPSTFAVAAACAAGAFALAVGLALGRRDAVWVALVVLAVTWLAYALLGMAVWRPMHTLSTVGRPPSPMFQTVFVCNTVAGAMGAGTAIALLGRRS